MTTETPSSNPKFLLHLHTESERASQQFTCVTKNKNKIHSRKSPFQCKAWSWHHHHHYYPLKNQREKKKYTENRVNNSSDQLYMQRTNNLTNETQTLLEEESGRAGTEEDIRSARGRLLRNVFTILLTCRCGGSHTWGSICMFRYRRPTWWLMSFENWTKKQARHWSREREKKETEEIREEEERERARQRARERKRTEGHGSLRWRFGWGATTAFILRRAHPTPSPPHPYLLWF